MPEFVPNWGRTWYYSMDYALEIEKRVDFVKKYLESTPATGIVFGNSGGKDSALVGAICSMACRDTVGLILPCGTSQNLGLESTPATGIVFGNSGGKDSALVGAICSMACRDTVGLILPCGTSQNLGSDRDDALALAKRFNIEIREINLAEAASALLSEISKVCTVSRAAQANIAPRLRMTALYTVAGSENRIVAGTGNACERYLGYFTKWGDGAFDINPIADLTVSQIYGMLKYLCERYLGYFTKWGDGAFDINPIADLTVSQIYGMLKYLGAPQNIIDKAPSAGLYEGQTDEADLGVRYADVEALLNGESLPDEARAKIERYHTISEHKRRQPLIYSAER